MNNQEMGIVPIFVYSTFENMIVYVFALILAQITSSFGNPKSTHIPKDENPTVNNINDLPVIKEGEICDPGTTYKKNCNTCHCSEKKELHCTNKTCVDPKDVKRMLRSGDLPAAPEGACIPGIVYQNGCNGCFCDDKESIHCGTGKCDLSKRILYPGDLYEPFTDEGFNALEPRESFSSECTPGKAYKVNCNLCLCNEMNSLICDQFACLSLDGDSMNRISAFQVIGEPCKENDDLAVDNPCVTCTCVNGKTECTWQNNCEDNNYKQKLERTLDFKKIDPEKDSCVPGAVYMKFCNRCNCMIDATLRCTLMTCLNYAKTNEVAREHEYLIKHNL